MKKTVKNWLLILLVARLVKYMIGKKDMKNSKLLGTKMLLAVIMTDTGLVKETIIKFDEEINEKQVETLNYMFNNKLRGKSLNEINKPLEEYLYQEMADMVKVIKPIIEQIKKALFRVPPP